MMNSYVFATEKGDEAEVVFDIIKSDSSLNGKIYGISATITVNGVETETRTVSDKFFTRDEAAENIKMLCKYQVTPCTLADVL